MFKIPRTTISMAFGPPVMAGAPQKGGLAGALGRRFESCLRLLARSAARGPPAASFVSR